jgi:hypothetical protein
MPKSDVAREVDGIQAVIAACLKPFGFRKSGRTFNCERADGIVGVVNLQMGSYPIGDHVIPGLRENLYGRFAVNLGVRLPCIATVERTPGDKKIYQEHDCHFRNRLSRLVDGKEEQWWSVEGDCGKIGRDIAALLETIAVPFINQFSSYREVIAYYDHHGVFPFRTDARSALDAALVCRYCGQHERYMSLMEEAKRRAGNNKGFRDYVSEIEKRLELAS